MKIEITIDDHLVDVWRQMKGILTKRHVGYVTACGMLFGTVTPADAAVKPHTFVAGQPAVAAQVNDNFDVLYDAVTANEETLATLRTSSFFVHPMAMGTPTGSNHLDSYDGYAYWGGTTSIVRGNIGVNLPVGAVMTDFTCYFYNDSAVPEVSTGDAERTYFRGALRRTNLATGIADGLATIDEWPAQAAAIQDYTAAVDDGVIEEGYTYVVQMEIHPGLA